jgi:hypothetical protein
VEDRFVGPAKGRESEWKTKGIIRKDEEEGKKKECG